jgi:hypothetical protein
MAPSRVSGHVSAVERGVSGHKLIWGGFQYRFISQSSQGVKDRNASIATNDR